MYTFDFEMPDLSWRESKIPKPKKPGEFRKITIPNDALKAVQEEILKFLVSVDGLRPSIYAHGFIPHRSTVTGVLRHDRLADVILCMDVKDFFDTFPIEPVRNRMLDAGLSEYLTDKILKACTYKGTLPQGGPCSPYLTNIGMYEVDLMLGAYARRLGFDYTRYADDLTFSQRFEVTGNRMWKSYYGVYCGVDKMLRAELCIRLNRPKSHCIRLHGIEHRRVTGVVIRQDGLGYNAPRSMRKKARSMVHKLYWKVKAQRKLKHADHALWNKTRGYVRYMDWLRSAGQGDAAKADPFINAGKFKYLEVRFGTRDKQHDSEQHGTLHRKGK